MGENILSFNLDKPEYKFFIENLSSEEKEIKGERNYFVTGYISTPDLDLVQDIVSQECLKDMLLQLKSGNIKLDVSHETFKKIPIGRIFEAGLDATGLWIKALINKASKYFKEVWESVKNKFLDAFSIAYLPKEFKTDFINGEPVRILNKVKLLNVALTGNPANPNCRIVEVFAKSLDDHNKIENITQEEFFERLFDVKAGAGNIQALIDWVGTGKEGFNKCVSALKGKAGIKDPEAVCAWLQREGGKYKPKGKKDINYPIHNISFTDVFNDLIKIKSIIKEKKMTDKDKDKDKTDEEKKKEEEEKKKKETEAKETKEILASVKKVEERLEKLEKKDDDDKDKDKTDDDKDKDKTDDAKKDDDTKEEVKEIKKELTEIKELLAKPQFKAIQEQMKKGDVKEGSPLDAIK